MILKKEDRGRIAEENGKRKINSISDLVLVHKTDYIPEGGVIKSSKDASVNADTALLIDGKEYVIDIPVERDTIHFTLNGEVKSHAYGNWDNTKYAIIIPLEKMDKSSIIGGISVDIYTRGSVKIPEGSYILCPETEMENIQRTTKNMNVVGYEGEIVSGYANMFLSKVLGYKKQKIGDWTWEDNKEDQAVVDEIIDKMRMGGWST